MRISLLAVVFFVASCSVLSLEEKSMQITIGMDMESVLSKMGRYPDDRRVKDTEETWIYCGFKPWSLKKSHFVIILMDDVVVGHESLDDNDGVCSVFRPIDRERPIEPGVTPPGARESGRPSM